MHVPPPQNIIYLAEVMSLDDPKGLGRVQVQLKGFVAGDLTLPWLRTIQHTASAEGAGGSHGMVFLPEVGDEVVVLRGNGDHIDSMFIMGAVYHANNEPFVTNDDKNLIKHLRTSSGNELIFNDEGGKESITISCPEGEVIVIMDNKAKSITLKAPKKIEILADKEVYIKGTDKVTVEAKEIIVNSDMDSKHEAGTNFSIKGGANVKIEGAANVDIKGGAMVNVKGAMVNIN